MDTVRIEKFFIESDSFTSKTLAYLQLNDKDEMIEKYVISQSQDKLALLSTFNNLYTFVLRDLESESKEVDDN